MYLSMFATGIFRLDPHFDDDGNYNPVPVEMTYDTLYFHIEV